MIGFFFQIPKIFLKINAEIVCNSSDGDVTYGRSISMIFNYL